MTCAISLKCSNESRFVSNRSRLNLLKLLRLDWYRIYRFHSRHFTLDWSSSGLWVKCDVSVDHFGQNITKQTANSYITIATSPSPVQIQPDRVHIWSSPIRILSQSTSIGWIRIQSKSNPLAFTVHTGGLASPKSSRNPIRDLWTHLKCRNNRLKWRDAAEFFKPACLYLEIRGWTLSDVWTCFSNPSVSVWEKIEVKVCKVWLQSSSDVWVLIKY